MVGDSAKDDIVCGNRAGARTALLDVEGRYANAPPQGEEAPTHAVRSMGELAELLRREYQLLPPVADTAAAAAAAAGGSR
jgi:FMN phosphatase YigB (HAD superfamily)